MRSATHHGHGFGLISLSPGDRRSGRSITSCAADNAAALGRLAGSVHRAVARASPKKVAKGLPHRSCVCPSGRLGAGVSGSSLTGGGLHRTFSRDSEGSVTLPITGGCVTVSVSGGHTTQNRSVFTPLVSPPLPF